MSTYDARKEAHGLFDAIRSHCEVAFVPADRRESEADGHIALVAGVMVRRAPAPGATRAAEPTPRAPEKREPGACIFCGWSYQECMSRPCARAIDGIHACGTGVRAATGTPGDAK